MRTLTGEDAYREPGPGSLLVRSDHPAFITTLVLPPSGVVSVITAGQVPANETVSVPLPVTLGYTQVFSVASLVPMNVSAAQGARSLNEAARVVEAQAKLLPAGAYTVAQTNYRIARFGSLHVTASVPGAQIRLNDRVVGQAPLLISDLPEGFVRVEVSRPGFPVFSQQVSIPAGGTAEVRAYLRPITAVLIVKSNVPARVLLDGRPVGNTPLRLPVRPGNLNVNVIPSNAALRPETVLVQMNAKTGATVNCVAANSNFTCTAQ